MTSLEPPFDSAQGKRVSPVLSKAEGSPDSKIPQHVAVIMDGNGRWARKQGYPRYRGHEEGVNRVEEITRAADRAGVRYLTLYAFSKENWKRPADEVGFLMSLLAQFLDSKMKIMMENNVIFKVIGEVNDLPSMIQKKLEDWIQKTKSNTGLTLNIAFSYSSRFEITRACKTLVQKAVEGKLKPSEVTEELVAAELYTAGLPDPDLLIRTSGEMRISNFLLWQLSYSELYVTETLWPDFHEKDFLDALSAYAQRDRRFGLTEAQMEAKK